MEKFSTVTVAKAKSSTDLKRLFVDPPFKSNVFIVKPSWYSPHLANFTEAETLRMLLDALDGEVIVTESYSMDRQDGTMKFSVDGKEVDWRWLLKHPGWGWIREEGRWDLLRRQEKWFLDEHGFTDLFQEKGIEYVNITEEVWCGKVADPREVKAAVEERFQPVFREEMYGFVPKALYDHRGATLISFGRVKGIGGMFPSLTMKNLFGLIPDPLRSWWHGPRDCRLGRSIVDINKVYAALFNVYGVCEAIRYATVSCDEGQIRVPWGNYNVLKDPGIVVLGPSLMLLDAVACALIGVDPFKVSYISLGEESFGKVDRTEVDRARTLSQKWFPIWSK